MASLESEIARLETRTRALEREARTLAVERAVDAPMTKVVAPQSAAPPVVHGKATAVEAPAEPASLSPPQPFEEKLEQAFSEEVIDPAWAESTANLVVDSFSARLPQGSFIRDVDCRGSLCRMEILHRTDEGHADLIRAIMQPPLLWEGLAQ